MTYLSSLGIQNSRLDTEEGHRGTSRLGFNRTREGSDDDTTCLCLPESIDDCAFPLANMIVIPMPRLGIDRLSDGTQHTERREIVILDVMFAQPTEETDGGGCRVELGQFVFLDGLPVS